MTSRSTAGLVLLACAALPLALGGCLDASSRARVEATGRVRFEQTTTLDVAARDEVLCGLAALFGADAPPAALPFADPFCPRWIRLGVREAQGVQIDALERTEEEGVRTTTLVATADSLEAAAQAGLFFPFGVRLRRHAARGVWTLTLLPPEPDTSEDGVPRLGGHAIEDVLAAAGDALSGFELRATLVLPADVGETNGTLASDGRTVTWSARAADLAAGRGRLDVTFADAEDLELQPFLTRTSGAAVMRRALEAPPGAR